jgi:hypothetical protein
MGNQERLACCSRFGILSKATIKKGEYGAKTKRKRSKSCFRDAQMSYASAYSLMRLGAVS